jgi:hypothetical protein
MNDKARWCHSSMLRLAPVLAVIIGTAVVLSTPHDRYFTPPADEAPTVED